MPSVLFSCVENARYRGWGAANGGIKLMALWVKLLNQHGIDAAIVTYDGTYTPWLIERPPVISMDTARAWKQQGRDLRWLTGWIVSDDFIALAERFYFFDAEMAYTAGDKRHHRLLSEYLGQKRIVRVGTHSRTIQAWYMASFGFGPYHIQEWSDPDYWRPHADVREPGLVGYMNEGPHTAATVERVKTLAQAAGATVRFIEISGNEQQVLDAMQRCDLFLGMNPGKHPLWGEGCPRSPQEAMHVGAVPVVFDVLGNHEYLIDDFTGRMVSNGDVTAMAEAVVDLMRNPEHKERLRQQGVSLMQTCWVGAHRWSMVKEFLDL